MSVDVTYITTVDDYVAYALHAWENDPPTQVRFRRIWVIPPVVLLVAALGLDVSPDARPAVCLVLAAAFLHLCFYPSFDKWRKSSMARTSGGILLADGQLGPTRLILTEDSLTEITRSIRSKVEWQDMKGMQVSADSVCIWTTATNRTIIPRHGCQSDADYERLRAYVEERFASVARRATSV